MRISIFLILILAIAFVSCKKEYDQQLQGHYTGIFGRSAPNIRTMPSKVSLTLDEKSFTGSSEFPKYPAICSGSWKADNKKIKFANGCFWTAEFDHTLILNGEYNYEWKGDTLYISIKNGETTDVYKLQKQ